MVGGQYKRWSATSEAAKHLEEIVRSGVVDENISAKALYQSDPQFRQYSLNSFRPAFVKLKQKFGIHIREPTTEKIKVEKTSKFFNDDVIFFFNRYFTKIFFIFLLRSSRWIVER